MVNNPELINKMINNINKLDDELIKEAIQEIELEEGIEHFKHELSHWLSNYDEEYDEKMQSIFNKITNRIKQLEEENAMLKKANNISEDVTVEDITKVVNKSLEEFKREFIPISVIQNKIEKYKREFDFYAGREHFEWQDGEFDGQQCDDIALKIGVLQELLEERNK